MPRKKNDYVTLKIPKEVMDLVDDYLKDHPEYTSRADLVKDLFRHLLNDLRKGAS